jgi:hypothetical protein
MKLLLQLLREIYAKTNYGITGKIFPSKTAENEDKNNWRYGVFYFFGVVLLLLPLLSYSSLQAGIYLSSIDNLDGESIKKNEIAIKEYLETILENPEDYAINIYERNGISYQFKRTKLMYHSFYVITDSNGTYHTLSFYRTKIAFYSEGAWIMDGDSDKQAYDLFMEGEDKWDVIEIKSDNEIYMAFGNS